MKKDITFNYYSVQGWMVKDLNLKGNELAVFAIIYGFSQDNETVLKSTLLFPEQVPMLWKQVCAVLFQH